MSMSIANVSITALTATTYRLWVPLDPPSTHRTWAFITLVEDDSVWVLQIHSEYGGWSVHWPAVGSETFREMLARAHADYLVRKLLKEAKAHFNLQATVERISGWINDRIDKRVWMPQQCKEVIFTPAQARRCRHALGEIADGTPTSSDLFAARVYECPQLEWLYNAHATDGLCVMEPDPACVEMVRLVWPCFVGFLKEKANA